MSLTTPTTELEAVNAALSVIGEPPVDDLRLADTNVDVKLALQFLRTATRSLLLHGWKFNTDEDLTLYRNPDDTISLPTNAARCVHAEADTDTEVDLVIRGQRLYNRANHSYVWDQDVRCDITYLLAFEELPEPVRNYLTEAVGRKFQARALGSQTLDAFTQEDIAAARSILSDFELDSGRYNFLNDSQSVVGAWGRY